MEERIQKIKPTKLDSELEIANIKKTNPGNPIMEEVERVKNVMNQAMGIKENLISEEQESVIEKTLTMNQPKLMGVRNRELKKEVEFLK